MHYAWLIMIKPRPQLSHSQLWPDTQPAPLAPADGSLPTLAQVVRRYREANASARAAANADAGSTRTPIEGLDVSEIDSDTTFDRLFGPETRPVPDA